MKPYIIIRGKGKRISFKEQLQYDKRATVRFQENAWCDGPAMEYWANNCWKPYVKDETLHKAKKSERITGILKNECNVTPIFVPAGCTSIIQPLDVSYNAPFKKKVEEYALKHMNDNLEDYLHGKFTAGERRILITHWVGDAWEELSKDLHIAVRLFKKCGISTAAEGSEDFKFI